MVMLLFAGSKNKIHKFRSEVECVQLSFTWARTDTTLNQLIFLTEFRVW